MDAEGCRLQIVCRKNMAFCAMLRVSTNLCKSFFLREMLHDVNYEHIFWVRFRAYKRHLKGRERWGRAHFTPFRRALYDLVTKPFVNCCCFKSLDELGLMEYLGNKSSQLIKVITAVFYISASARLCLINVNNNKYNTNTNTNNNNNIVYCLLFVCHKLYKSNKI